MQEYTTQAIILTKEPSGEMDVQACFLTPGAGKLTARAKSARKITSKLSAHLEPGNIIAIRLVEKKGIQITDALSEGKLSATPTDLYFLGELLPEGEPEPALWEELMAQKTIRWAEILKLLGWDPKATKCQHCHERTPEYFNIKNQELLCKICTKASRLDSNKVLYIGDEH